jgi:hypothetical protein
MTAPVLGGLAFGPSMIGPIQAVWDLSDAFATRDLDAALACFVPDDEIGYAGSEDGETATDRAALTELLSVLFKRDETLSWEAATVTVHQYGTTAYLFADALGAALPDEGSFAYRGSGLLEIINGRWLWRHCHGYRPAPAGSDPEVDDASRHIAEAQDGDEDRPAPPDSIDTSAENSM